MKRDERNQLRKKFRNIFRIVSRREKHQQPELVDKANQIIHLFQQAEPEPRRGFRAFRPLPYVSHPALAGNEKEREWVSDVQG